MPVAVDHAAPEVAEPIAHVYENADPIPVLDLPSLLAAHRAHGRHIATSGWLPRCTMRSGSSIDPQHHHCPGGGSGCLWAVTTDEFMLRRRLVGPLVP